MLKGVLYRTEKHETKNTKTAEKNLRRVYAFPQPENYPSGLPYSPTENFTNLSLHFIALNCTDPNYLCEENPHVVSEFVVVLIGYVPDPNETPNAKLAIFSGVGFVYYWDELCFGCC